MPRCVQTINTVKVNYLNVKPSSSGGWEPASGAEWISEPKAAPTENIWITLDDPKPPLGEWEKKKCIRTGLLDIACYLALGSQTSDDVRRKTTKNLYDWLISKGFYYNKKSIHFKTNDKGNGKFDYATFMDVMPQPNDTIPNGLFSGDCQDISSLYVLCCASLGVEMELNKFLILIPQPKPPKPSIVFITKVIKTASHDEYSPSAIGKDDWEKRPTEYRQWPMQMHQVAALDGLVWDPLLNFKISPWAEGFAIAVTRHDYAAALIEKNSEITYCLNEKF